MSAARLVRYEEQGNGLGRYAIQVEGRWEGEVQHRFLGESLHRVSLGSWIDLGEVGTFGLTSDGSDVYAAAKARAIEDAARRCARAAVRDGAWAVCDPRPEDWEALVRLARVFGTSPDEEDTPRFTSAYRLGVEAALEDKDLLRLAGRRQPWDYVV